MKKHFIEYFSLLIVLLFCCQTSGQEGLEISLRADYEQEKKVWHNEPVIFMVSLANKVSQSDQLWNISANRRIRQIDDLLKQGKIKPEDAAKEKQELEKGKRSSEPITIGSASSPWTTQLKWIARNRQNNATINLPVKPMTNPAVNAAAVISESANAVACFGISPDDMMTVAAGEYEVSVTVNEVSDKIILVIQSQAVNERSMDETQWLKWGRFYWYAGDSKRTMSYAEMIIKANASSADGYSLKGDAQVMAESYLPALESYSQAVKLYYKQYGSSAEPPEYLYSMIGMVKEKLGDVKQ
jgi:tetratricopeptide (TPR) repeat protein